MSRNKPPARTVPPTTRRTAAALDVQPPGRNGAAAPKRTAADHQTAAAVRPVTRKPTEAATATAGSPAPMVLIELDPATAGGFIRDRFDIQLRGRVAAAAPVESVEFVVQGDPAGRIDYGRTNRGPTITLPDGSSASQRAFQFTLPRPQAKAAGPCPLRIRATTADGQMREQAFELTVDPNDPMPVRVIAGPTRSLVSYAVDPAPLVLYVERASIDAEGGLLLHGWSVASNPLVTVQAFLDDKRLPSAQLGGTREDVAAYYAAYPNARTSGFSLTAQKAGGTATTVRVQAISRNGFSHEVMIPLERPVETSRRPPVPPAPPLASEPKPAMSAAPSGTTYRLRAGFQLLPDGHSGVVSRPIEIAESEPAPRNDGRREIHYFCDEAMFRPDGTLRVVGWGFCETALAEITILLDGEPIGTAELGLSRPDVGAEFPTIPAAKSSGFWFEQLIPSLAEGDHDVRVTLRTVLGEERTETRRLHADKPVRTPARAVPAPPRAEVPEFRFELDNPQVLAGKAVDPITGRLIVEGWVLARSGVAAVEISLDDQRMGEAHYGLARPDVGTAFPDWNSALRSGYAFHCPPRALHNGEHVVRVTVRARNGEVLEHLFRIEVKKSEEDDELTSIRQRMTRVETTMLAGVLDSLGYRPQFHLLLLQGAAIALDGLHATLESLRTQTYADWRLTVLASDADAGFAVRLWLAEHGGALGDRVVVRDGTEPGFDARLIAHAGDDAVLCGVLCPGDLLGCDALAEIALAGGLYGRPDFLYADEARLSPASNEREPFFKPDFSPDLLLSTNYIGRPWFAAGALLAQCDLTPRALFEAGEYDLVLRCTEQARAVHHVPRLLAQRGPVMVDDDAGSRTALARAAERRGFAATVLDGCLPGTYRLRRAMPAKGKVSIIIPTCAAHGHIENCIRTLRTKTGYRNFEIVCIDNIPATEANWKAWLRQNADRVVDIPEAFNWSRFNNRAAKACEGEYLLFLNDDIEIEQEDWLDALLEHAQRPEVGVVGPQLVYPGGKVQHAGMFLGAGIGRHAFRFAPGDEPGYFGLALTQRNVIAVTGACMLMRRSFFEAMHGFEEAHSVINNDVDFCLRAHQAGKLTVFTPHASLIHHELASRGAMGDKFDTTAFDARWRTLFAAGDPYFNPRLSRHSDDYRPDDEAVQAVFPGHPLFEHAEIRRILVMKLDHIGDFITALPAIRRLKTVFPQASLSVLAGRAARAVTVLEPAIDEFIEFEFFHARSQLGEKDLTKEDFEALLTQLAPYRFDLAIDLRKHLSTRDVLRYTGARFLAGYDYMGQFPFLDVALEWDGDKTLQRKRSHVMDDLLALVEAVNTATMHSRDLIAAPPEPIALDTLPAPAQALFDRPVVAIHAGAGNITKQWPEGYFVGLIHLLLEQDGVNVLLVGGPDDRALSDSIMQSGLPDGRMASVAGALSLAELPRLLVRCALYIGNDSGPKHIAAAVGVPTIGIHSGVVDAVEWGPVGSQAVALRRNMACSPCYLARAEDCPRGLACLRFLEPAVVHETARMLLARPVTAPAVHPVVERPVQPRPQRLEAKAAAAPAAKAAATLAATSAAGNGNGKPAASHAAKPARPASDPPRSKPRFKTGRQGAPA